MPNENMEPGVSACPKCGQAMHPAMVKTAIWRGERLCVVEDIPAQVCDVCTEQFYDEETTDALRQLMEEDTAVPKREVLVSVYSLERRIHRREPDPEGVYADY